MAKLTEFWFEFGSPYSYLSAHRIDALASDYGVEIVWRPFLLGPIFAQMGWHTSPFNIYPEKGRYMWRDVQRRALKYGLPFKPLPASGPAHFPQNGLAAARIALVGLAQDWGKPFIMDVFQAQFAQGHDISDKALLKQLALSQGALHDALSTAQTQANKLALKQQTEQAQRLGLFGAPSFVVGAEIFWGDDRLEDALEYAIAAA